jgi:hypothetical protein
MGSRRHTSLRLPAASHQRVRLSLELATTLADKLVELGIVEEISYQTVRRILKKTNLSRT